MTREWIIFALCLGLGGHIALGFILHAPEQWTMREAGMNGLLGGLGVYLGIQLFRTARWIYKGKVKST